MITKEVAALMALRVYEERVDADINQPTFPYEGWALLNDPRLPAVTNGFAYGVFRNQSTGEIVISYRGTDGAGSMLGFDGLNNAALSDGLPSSQGRQAAQVYAEVLRLFGVDTQGSNISFTGHSLGGGLASIMAVWFNRPAIVFDPAPFRPTAQSELRIGDVLQLLGNNAPQALRDFDPVNNYANRSQQVTGYFAVGEFLNVLRTDGNSVNLAAILPQQFGNQNVSGFTMHSQALLTMGLMSTNFRNATVQVQNALPIILSSNLYSQETKGLATRNFLIDLIRSEQANPGNSKLTHFAADLQKLGTNLVGLNKAAQEAMIAQGVEWYYWQSNNYAGAKEFFTQTGTLLQYTTAKGDALEGALSKADLYTKPWLQAIAAEHGVGTATFPAFGTAYDQWSVATSGTVGVTATALDTGKTQIMLGQAGADNLTGGTKDDVIFAGAGNDTLNGAGGNDKLFGGAGNDTYQFTGTWGKDTIIDADGQGSIQLGGASLGTAKGVGVRDQWAFDLGGGQYAGIAVTADSSSSTGYRATIVKGTDTANTITIQNFNLNQALTNTGYLGIKLDPTQRVALIQGTAQSLGASTSNMYADLGFNTASLAGQSSQFNEGNGKTFSINLAVAAHAGDTITLSANGAVAGNLQAVLGDSTVDANGAVITLAEGQTQVSFALVSSSAIEADVVGVVSASYAGCKHYRKRSCSRDILLGCRPIQLKYRYRCRAKPVLLSHNFRLRRVAI